MTARSEMTMSTFTFGSDFLSLLRELLFNPEIHPIDECFVPENTVLRLENPVAFIGEDQKFRRHFLQLQGGEQLDCLIVWHAVGLFPGDPQSLRGELLHCIGG